VKSELPVRIRDDTVKSAVPTLRILKNLVFGTPTGESLKKTISGIRSMSGSPVGVGVAAVGVGVVSPLVGVGDGIGPAVATVAAAKGIINPNRMNIDFVNGCISFLSSFSRECE
jgi:hypothetical protein